MLNSAYASLFVNEYQKTTASLKEIAKYHGINYNTLKSYANRHNWKKNNKDNMTLERIYYPDKCSKIPYRVVVFGFLVSFFSVNQESAYRFAYGSNKTTSRVNSYRLLKREDTQFIMEYSRLLKDASSCYNDFVELLKPVYKAAFLDAKQIADRIRNNFKNMIDNGNLDRLYTEEVFKRYTAERLEPEPLCYMKYQDAKL